MQRVRRGLTGDQPRSRRSAQALPVERFEHGYDATFAEGFAFHET